MRKYRIGICDDERGTCAEIEESVYRFFESYTYDVDVEVWLSGEDFVRSLEESNNMDILFLDIELPGENGVSIGKRIRGVLDNSELQIVYISSKTGYALELFQVHPYDFLIKPITCQAISDTLEKLPAQFVMVAKSFIVNMKYISSFCSSSLEMQNGIKISITAPHRDEFRLNIVRFLEGEIVDERNC